MSKNRHSQVSIKQLLIGSVLAGATIIIVVFSICRMAGRCYINYSSTIQELSICSKDDDTFTDNLRTTNQDLAICGVIEGTTPRPGRLYVYYEDEVVYQTGFEHMPGAFSQTLPVLDLRPGSYRIEISYAKELQARTEFEVLP